MKTSSPNPAETREALKQILDICRLAWEKGFMAGWSGNASVRLETNPDLLLITGARKAKGRLGPEDCPLVNSKGEKLSGKARVSSESRLHTLIYEKLPAIKAILHSHPPFLQALELALTEEKAGGRDLWKEKFLDLKLHEAAVWRDRLAFGLEYPPGSEELARSALEALTEKLTANRGAPLPFAVWLPKHGLCAVGELLEDCLCLTEELEHLALTQLMCREKFNNM